MNRPLRFIILPLGIGIPFATFVLPAVATDLQLPGTQPQQVGTLSTPSQCDNCHGGFDPITEPDRPWRGSMMAQAGRDPVFWATMAIAEQDFAGSGDFCLRCHAPRGWLEGRVDGQSTGAGLASQDQHGVECGICHQLCDPDDTEHLGTQVAPYVANDGNTPATAFLGSGMMVMLGGNTRLGPYAPTAASHAYLQSSFHRSADLCGTCHDVSNPVTGDLAPQNGAMTPLLPGTFSGVPGTPVAGKAAFNNFPFQYGIVERTFSEHQASGFATLPISGYATLPAELQRGIVAAARTQALLANPQGNHQDGTPRFFTCQTCHMLPVVGKGAAQSAAPIRTDLGQHDLTGGSTWQPDLILWANQNNRLRLGGGMTTLQQNALSVGKQRARDMLRLAAALDVDVDTLRIVNLTGHKLFSGYPEGRRMWLRTKWRDRQGAIVRTDGAYGPIQVNVAGTAYSVDSLLQPDDPNLRIWQAKFGLSQAWANRLLALGKPASLPLEYDRITGAVAITLGQLAAQPVGSTHASFHFVLNDTVLADNRIPPFGMRRTDAATRNALPVPASLYGNPAPGGTYQHADAIALQPPAGATHAEFELLYQAASWEYVQFLRLANTQQIASLATTGIDLFDGWRATGMSPPEVMATNAWCRLPGTGDDLDLQSGIAGQALDRNCAKTVVGGQTARFRITSPNGTFVGGFAAFAFEVYRTDGPRPLELLPGIQLDRADQLMPVVGVPAAGATLDLAIPPGFDGHVIRAQGIVLSPQTLSGFLGTSPAHDVSLR
jgi:hypothetical protein